MRYNTQHLAEKEKCQFKVKADSDIALNDQSPKTKLPKRPQHSIEQRLQ